MGGVMQPNPVIPAKAGISPLSVAPLPQETPAFAGVARLFFFASSRLCVNPISFSREAAKTQSAFAPTVDMVPA